MKTPPQGNCEGAASLNSDRVFHSPKRPKIQASPAAKLRLSARLWARELGVR